MGQAHIHSLSLPALFTLAAATWTCEGGGCGVSVELRGQWLRRRRGATRAAALPWSRRQSPAKGSARSRRRGEWRQRWTLLPCAEEADLTGAIRVGRSPPMERRHCLIEDEVKLKVISASAGHRRLVELEFLIPKPHRLR
uniref:Uncharacterized protein n=1 Tax=Oryza barthii TaxID=65489 RepID=A0A0D3F3W3_9ORYZ